MKFMIALASLLISAPAFAICERVIDAHLQQELEDKGWSYHGIEKQEARDVWDILDRADISDNAKDMLKMHLEEGGVEFFLMTGTADYSAGFQEMIVASKTNCRIVNRVETYSE